ncbi:hypothetical protein NCC49_005304 [Naganishia albida]|nr:hypothetical protein NCC49_005304 [Naganishia albida]
MTGTPTPKQDPTSGPSAASKRREANRLAAARFRTRKKDQVTELENRVHDLEAENFHLKAVNRTLRKRCGVADEQVVEVDDEFAAGRPAWRREVAGERFISERAASEAAHEFAEAAGDPSKKRRRTGGKGGDPAAATGYHHLDRSVSASGDADPYGQLQDENDRLQNQMRAYEDRLRHMTDELVGLRHRVREETGNGSEGSDHSPEGNYRDPRHPGPGPTYAPAPTYTPFTLDPALTGAAGDPRYNGLSPSTSHANPVLTLASAASNARVLQRQPSQQSLVLPLSPAMRLGGDVPPIGYASPGGGSLSVNTLLDNTGAAAARVSPSMAHQQPYGSRPGSPMTIRAFEALTEAVAAVDAQAAHEASLSSPNTASGGGGGVARRAWNMQPNNNLGPLTSLSRTSSRGMDSPVSAERSGLAGDEDDSDEYMANAAANAAAAQGTSSARHLTGTSVLSSSRDGSPIGSSLEYFDRRMGGSAVARSTTGTATTTGRGGSKLRDMDIDMDVTPAQAMDEIDPQLDPALANVRPDQADTSNLGGPATGLPSAPVEEPIPRDDNTTPTAGHSEAEAVPRIAFEQVQ